MVVTSPLCCVDKLHVGASQFLGGGKQQALPGCLLGLPAPAVHGAEATDGLCDKPGSLGAAWGTAPCPCGACPVCSLSAALPDTAGNVQGLRCCLAADAFREGVAAAFSGPNSLFGAATGCEEGWGWMMGWGCGLLLKEDWRVMGAETQLGKGAGVWGLLHPEDTILGGFERPEDISTRT